MAHYYQTPNDSPQKMEKFLRILSIASLLLTALNALIAGLLFMIDPSGSKMGMTVDYLRFSPFRSFLIPGLVLFSVNGILSLLTAFSIIKHQANAPVLIIIQGILLGGWILIQIIMVRDINPLHIIMFIIGVILVTCGTMLWKAAKS